VELPGTVAAVVVAATLAFTVAAAATQLTAAVVRTAEAAAAMPECMVVAEADAVTEVAVQPTAKTQRSDTLVLLLELAAVEATTVSVVATVVVALEEVCFRNVHWLTLSPVEVAALEHTAAEQLLVRVPHERAAADSVAEQAVSLATAVDSRVDSAEVVCTVADWPAALVGLAGNWDGSFRSLDCVALTILTETKYLTRLTQALAIKRLVADKHQVTLTPTTQLAGLATS